MTALVVLALLSAVANAVMFAKMLRCHWAVVELMVDMRESVRKEVYELLSRASFSWEAGFQCESVVIRFDNGLTKEAKKATVSRQAVSGMSRRKD